MCRSLTECKIRRSVWSLGERVHRLPSTMIFKVLCVIDHKAGRTFRLRRVEGLEWKSVENSERTDQVFMINLKRESAEKEKEVVDGGGIKRRRSGDL